MEECWASLTSLVSQPKHCFVHNINDYNNRRYNVSIISECAALIVNTDGDISEDIGLMYIS